MTAPDPPDGRNGSPVCSRRVSTMTRRDYRLTGPEGAVAASRGLVSADWYQCEVPRQTMRQLMERSDGRAIRDTVLWLSLLIGSGWLAHVYWATWWCVPAFIVYGVLYGSVGDSRWHEGGHGTAFKTPWMNNFVYQLGSFMITREPVSWRWSHARHHSDTIIVGRDPEIAAPRPTPLWFMVLAGFGLPSVWSESKKYAANLIGRIRPEEADYLPQSEWRKSIWSARAHVVIWLGSIVASITLRTVEPLMFVGLPTFYGKWLSVIYGFTQHAGLAEDVLDHRLNTRTVRMNRVHRFLYWNMNYHVEHHMFPTVPFHHLPALHEAVKADMPTPYSGILSAYREIIPAVARQKHDTGYFVRRPLPTPASSRVAGTVSRSVDESGGWVPVCQLSELQPGDMRRCDHGDQTFAVYRLHDGSVCATDGLCTHGRAHLSLGHLSGNIVECPKHNGRFDVTNGAPCRAPAKVALKTHAVELRGDMVLLRVPDNADPQP
jgi:Na+-transporting NADH:ubiquinone oxidoreductase subunit F